jgi:predicted phosphodiesterase
MTKIHILSDLHLEFGPHEHPIPECDVVVLAGDIGNGIDGLKHFAGIGVPVVKVMGNHTTWTRSIDETEGALRKAAAETDNVSFLEKDVVIIAGVRFLGTTLWTDFALNGDPHLAMIRAQGMIEDHRRIVGRDGNPLLPDETRERHLIARKWLEDALDEPFDGPTVVVTHHLPCAASVPERFRGSPISGAYASALDNLAAYSPAKLWIHGHTHDSRNVSLGDVRIMANPKGYSGKQLNPEFDPELVVEVR